MKYILILLIVLTTVACSATSKQKLNTMVHEVGEVVKILNDKYCAETNQVMRDLIIQQIKFYVPIYPVKGYCPFVEGDEDVK